MSTIPLCGRLPTCSPVQPSRPGLWLLTKTTVPSRETQLSGPTPALVGIRTPLRRLPMALVHAQAGLHTCTRGLIIVLTLVRGPGPLSLDSRPLSQPP